jgi:hypothetical protein
MIGFDVTDGEVADDIQGEYDIPNKTIITTPPESKVGIVTASIVSPVITYNNKETTIGVDAPSTAVNYHSQQSSILVSKPSPEIIYENKEGSVVVFRTQPQVNYNNIESSVLVETSEPNVTYNGLESSISDIISTSLNSSLNSLSMTILNRDNLNKIYDVSGLYNSLENYGSFDIETNTKYIRENISKTTASIDYGYGLGWITGSNAQSKLTALMEFIETPRQDGFYSGYYLYYSSSKDMVGNLFYSSSLTSSKTTNQQNAAIGLQNHRFIGSKLVGPDINVNTRNTPDSKPVVEVHNVGSTQIIYNTYFDRGNLIGK